MGHKIELAVVLNMTEVRIWNNIFLLSYICKPLGLMLITLPGVFHWDSCI